MPLTLSGNGTITGLVAGGLPDGTITGSDLAASAAATNLAGTTVPGFVSSANFSAGPSSYGGTTFLPTYDLVQRSTRRHGYFTPSASGARWCRAAILPPRFAYNIHISTTGGEYAPSYTSFTCMLDYNNTLYIGGVIKLGSQYVTNVRYQTTTPNGGSDYYLEFYFNAISSVALQGFHISIENLTQSDMVSGAGFNVMGSGLNIGTFGTSLANLTYTGTSIAL